MENTGPHTSEHHEASGACGLGDRRTEGDLPYCLPANQMLSLRSEQPGREKTKRSQTLDPEQVAINEALRRSV